MTQSSESYDPGMLMDSPEAAQPLDLKKSLRIRDGLELARPKPIEGHILQSIRANLNQFTGICLN